MIKYGVILIICVYTASTASQSPCACTREYKPLCASDGVTYGNPCMLRCARARTGRELAARPGPCRARRDTSALCACPRNYAPVCANDGKTYPNECLFNCQRDKSNAILQILYPGECLTKNCFCPLIYSPVCGSDGSTYSNECELNCARSRNPTLRAVSSEKCQQDNIISSCVCPFLYKPVCGTDGKTYPNICALNCERNKNLALGVRSQGECPKDVCVCPYIYKPVCASDGQTYPSLCNLNCVISRNPTLSLAHQGGCQRAKRETRPDCQCDKKYAPVCADDGRTYASECLMQCHATQSGRAISVNHTGRCNEN